MLSESDKSTINQIHAFRAKPWCTVIEPRETFMGHFRAFSDCGCTCSPPLWKLSTCQVTCFPLSVQNADEEVLYLQGREQSRVESPHLHRQILRLSRQQAFDELLKYHFAYVQEWCSNSTMAGQPTYKNTLTINCISLFIRSLTAVVWFEINLSTHQSSEQEWTFTAASRLN